MNWSAKIISGTFFLFFCTGIYAEVNAETTAKSYYDSRPADTVLSPADTLKTGKNIYAEVVFPNGNRMQVSPQSELILTTLGDESENPDTRIEIITGSVFLEIIQKGNNRFELVTDKTITYIREGKIGVLSSGLLWVEEGTVEVMAVYSRQSSRIRAGMFAQISQEGSDILTGRLATRDLMHLNKQVRDPSRDIQELRFSNSLEEY